jgi:hypothetical protein
MRPRAGVFMCGFGYGELSNQDSLLPFENLLFQLEDIEALAPFNG